MRETKPVTVRDIPVLRRFFRKSTWIDMSLKYFLRLMLRPFFYRRIALSIKDFLQNKYFGNIMGKFSRKHGSLTYMYIGANDGIIGDTIMPYAIKYGWDGILVEPVPHVMKQLKKNFGNLKNVIFEQAAIDKVNGRRKLYIVRESGLAQPAFAQIIHSFSKDVVSGQEISWGFDKDEDIVPIEVETITIASLLVKHGIKKLDLIVIDAEGHDYEILKNIDFKQIHPSFIKFEHHNMTKNQQVELMKLLSQNGYIITKMRGDYFCRRQF